MPKSMHRGNILDIGLNAVRILGKTNMFHKKNVQYYAFHLGFYELVNYIEESKGGDYLTLLRHVDFNVTPHVDTEHLISLDSSEAREEICIEFKNEIKKFQQTHFDIKKIPASYDDFRSQDKNILQFISDNTSDHSLNYELFLGKNIHIYWFSDGVYAHSGTGLKMVDPKLWSEWRTSIYIGLSNENKRRMDILDKKHFRLLNLFQT